MLSPDKMKFIYSALSGKIKTFSQAACRGSLIRSANMTAVM
ncbi:hypothetical protein CSB66_1018 [Enterobacter hormaechei]|nr:hypothetical protein CSB66_1018 [Enterobacter hormaechei]